MLQMESLDVCIKIEVNEAGGQHQGVEVGNLEQLFI